jgi:hypothetical protein
MSKKRRIAELIGAMQRRDAIFPDVEENDLVFASLIAFSSGLLAQQREKPESCSLAFTIFGEYLKLRRDDIRFICDRISNGPLSAAEWRWLSCFTTSLAPRDRRRHMIRKMIAAAEKRETCRENAALMQSLADLFQIPAHEARLETAASAQTLGTTGSRVKPVRT